MYNDKTVLGQSVSLIKKCLCGHLINITFMITMYVFTPHITKNIVQSVISLESQIHFLHLYNTYNYYSLF